MPKNANMTTTKKKKENRTIFDLTDYLIENIKLFT